MEELFSRFELTTPSCYGDVLLVHSQFTGVLFTDESEIERKKVCVILSSLPHRLLLHYLLAN